MRTKLTLLLFAFMVAGFGKAQGQNDYTLIVVGQGEPPAGVTFTFTTIQEAIDEAFHIYDVDGEMSRILVYPGTYTQTLSIDVPYLQIKSKEGPSQTIISPPVSTFATVSINSPGVHLEGFTIDSGFSFTGFLEGESGGQELGIWATADRGTVGHGPTIKGNIIKNAAFGVYIDFFNESIIEGNLIEVYLLGIEFWIGSGHEFRQNTITSLEIDPDGQVDPEGPWFIIPSQGIRLVYSSLNIVKENIATGFEWGMVIDCDFLCFFDGEGFQPETVQSHRSAERGIFTPSRGNQISKNRIEAGKYGMRVVLKDGRPRNGNDPNLINENMITGEEFNIELIEPQIEDIILGGQSVDELVDLTCNWWGTALFSEIAGKFVDIEGNPIDPSLLIPYLIPSTSGEQLWPGGDNYSCEGGDIVRRKGDGKLFSTIQQAMDDEDTQDGDIIEVFGDTGEDNVNVYKQVEIRFYLRGSN